MRVLTSRNVRDGSDWPIVLLMLLSAACSAAFVHSLGLHRSTLAHGAASSPHQDQNPQLVGQIGTLGDGVAVMGSYAYVAAGGGGLQIVDVTNPVAPSNLGHVDISGIAVRVAVTGSFAYVAAVTGLEIVDVSNPAMPRKLGNFRIPGQAGGADNVTVGGSYAYLSDLDSGVWIVDVTNPAAPSNLGHVDIPNADGVAVAGSYLYVTDGAGLQVVDVTNPAAPRKLGRVDSRGSAQRIAVVGSYAYVADGVGLQVVDVTNPAAPRKLGRIDSRGSAHGVAVVGSYAYVGEGTGLQVVDVTNPATPRKLGRVDSPGDGQDVAVTGNYAYMAASDAGLLVFRLSPAEPTAVPSPTLGVAPTSTPLPTRTSPPPQTPTPAITPTRRPNGLDLSVGRLEITQAIQTLDNDVPLTADRPTVVRVEVAVSGSAVDVPNVTALLHAVRGGNELADSPIRSFNPGQSIDAPLRPSRDSTDETVNFLLPSNWTMVGSLDLWVEINPGHQIPESDYGDNRSADESFTFRRVPVLPITLIPIAYRQNGQGPVYRPQMTADNFLGLGILQKLYPVPGLKVAIHDEISYEGDLSSAAGWADLLGKIGELRLRDRPNEPWIYDATLMPKYYGVLPPEGSFYGGLGYVGGTTGMGLTDAGSIAAHEIGHNLGLLHIDCGGAGGVDPQYPYPDGFIGNTGFDVFDLRVIPSTYKELMSYCGPVWVSDYHYRKMQNVLQQSHPSFALSQGLIQQQGWLISGIISGNGTTGELQFAEQASVNAFVGLPGSGEFHLDARDSGGRVVYGYAFEPVTTDFHDQPPQPFRFGFAMPRQEGAVTIELWHGAQRLASLAVSPRPPQVQASYLPAGLGSPTLTLSWLAVSPDGTTPRVTVRYSRDGGTTWQALAANLTTHSLPVDTDRIAGSANGLFEIVANNGTDSAATTVSVGTIVNKPPQILLLNQTNIETEFGIPVQLSAVAADLEDGPLPDASLGWSELHRGLIGTGPSLVFPDGLSLGFHHFSLTATDSQGAQISTSITVSVVSIDRRIFLPIIIRESCKELWVFSDVTLVLDLSDSMSEPLSGGHTKLEAAQDAARTFLEKMDLTPNETGQYDQVAVVGFNDTAWIQQPLTNDKAAIEQALVDLVKGQTAATRMDLAFERAMEAMKSDKKVGNTPVVVLLTDGQPSGVPLAADGTMETTVIQAANAAKANGVRIFTIAIGAEKEVNPALLKACANDATQYFYTHDADKLGRIYTEIAYNIGCPTWRFWGRR